MWVQARRPHSTSGKSSTVPRSFSLAFGTLNSRRHSSVAESIAVAFATLPFLARRNLTRHASSMIIPAASVASVGNESRIDATYSRVRVGRRKIQHYQFVQRCVQSKVFVFHSIMYLDLLATRRSRRNFHFDGASAAIGYSAQHCMLVSALMNHIYYH